MIGIESRYVDDVWPVAAPLIQKVLDEYDTGYSLDDIKAACKACDMQLWMEGTKAAFITEIKVFPQYRALHIPYIGGGSMDEWFDSAMEKFEAFARHLGCKYVTGCGRRGWVKAGKHRGYTEGLTIVRKELE